MSKLKSVSPLTQENLERLLRGDAGELDAHLTVVERDIEIKDSHTKLHCHHIAVDGNGRIKVARLAEFMRDCVIDYTIPRTRVAEARAHMERYNTPSALVGLHQEAKRTFSDLKQSGEGGELLLFLIAERYLRLPQVLCKMSLKTASRMHYHGADGVYASADCDGRLLLHWGESKVYGNFADAIRDCLASLAPFLVDPESEDAARERDLLLLTDAANLDDPALVEAFRRYLDKRSPMSNRVRYCGIALVGFDSACYPTEDVETVADDIAQQLRAELAQWSSSVGRRLVMERLERFDIHFFCLPLPSAEGFRNAFRRALGIEDEARGPTEVVARRGHRAGARPAGPAKRRSRVPEPATG